MDATQSIWTVDGAGSYETSDSEAWSDIACPSCTNPSTLVIAKQESEGDYRLPQLANIWLLCIACGLGAVADGDGNVSPGVKSFPTPDGTPEAEEKLWEEVRNCLSVSAFNAVAMLCRKLLLHLVYTHERSQNQLATPRSIKFVEAVQYLLNNGVITAAMQPLATEIKNIGNRANHELPDVSEEQAQKIVLFTHYLFVSVYEMPTKASIPTPFVGAAAKPYEGDLEPDSTQARTNGD